MAIVNQISMFLNSFKVVFFFFFCFFRVYILNLKLDIGLLIHAWKQRMLMMFKKKLNWNEQNTCLPSFIICYHIGKSDHYAVINVPLGIFLLLRDIISSKTSSKIITATRCTHWYKSIEKRYGLNWVAHSIINYPHERTLSLHPSLWKCWSQMNQELIFYKSE